jgi:hypothetical protein
MRLTLIHLVVIALRIRVRRITTDGLLLPSSVVLWFQDSRRSRITPRCSTPARELPTFLAGSRSRPGYRVIHPFRHDAVDFDPHGRIAAAPGIPAPASDAATQFSTGG